jgi:methyl-accepting chemotaxis protein
MSNLNIFSLKRLNGRIFWAFVLLAVLMLLAGIGANFVLGDARNANISQLARARQVANIQSLNSLIAQQSDAIDVVNSYDVPRGLEFLATMRTRVGNSPMMTSILGQKDFPPGDTLTDDFVRLQNGYLAVDNLLQPNLQRSLSPNEQRAVFNEIRQRYDQLRLEADLLTRQAEQVAAQSLRNYLNVVDNTRTVYLTVSIGLFALAVIFAALISRLIARPIGSLIANLRRVSNGDLTVEIPAGGVEEAQELGYAFNQTVINLKQTIARIQEQSATVGATSTQIADSSDRQATSLSEQAVSLSQVSATVAELSDTSQNIADSATQVAASANIALDNANQGFDKMQGASDSMNEIRVKVHQISDRILSLNSVAQRIREITNLIDTISNETHLLALNAAIESAGAGEEGERFAVVAGHVRKLAQRARVAAVEIQELVNQIQHAAANSVMATEEGIKAVAVGERMVREGLMANESIIGQIEQTTQLALAISQATQQQRTGITQAADNMRQLNMMIGNITQNSQQFSQIANDLGEVVNELNAVANSFILHESQLPDADIYDEDGEDAEDDLYILDDPAFKYEARTA